MNGLCELGVKLVYVWSSEIMLSLIQEVYIVVVAYFCDHQVFFGRYCFHCYCGVMCYCVVCFDVVRM